MSIREPLLHFLETRSGEIVSGNELAGQLNVSRAAIWKAVSALRDEGYTIDAINKKGYRLVNDTLTPETVKAYIADPSFWKDVRVFDEVSSTNNVGKELAGNGAPNGTLLIAKKQTAGRGRLGRSFYSPPQSGLYMSVILRLDAPIDESMLITSAAAVAVCRAILATTGLSAQIKWVNDVYLNGKKVCGILTEAGMNIESRLLDYIVIGIGINILKSSFPAELCDTATSLEDMLPGISISRAALAGEVANQLQDISGHLAKRAFLEEYRRLSCVLGEKINVITPLQTESGTAVDINENGNLIVRMDNGELRTLCSSEVSIRRI